MSGNPRTDRVQMTINLRIVGGFVAAKIPPQEKAGNQQHHNSNDQEHAEARIARLKLPPLHVALTERGRAMLLRRPCRGRAFLSFGFGCHIYLLSRYCFTPCSANPMERASKILATLCAYKLLM